MRFLIGDAPHSRQRRPADEPVENRRCGEAESICVTQPLNPEASRFECDLAGCGSRFESSRVARLRRPYIAQDSPTVVLYGEMGNGAIGDIRVFTLRRRQSEPKPPSSCGHFEGPPSVDVRRPLDPDVLESGIRRRGVPVFVARRRLDYQQRGDLLQDECESRRVLGMNCQLLSASGIHREPRIAVRLQRHRRQAVFPDVRLDGEELFSMALHPTSRPHSRAAHTRIDDEVALKFSDLFGDTSERAPGCWRGLAHWGTGLQKSNVPRGDRRSDRDADRPRRPEPPRPHPPGRSTPPQPVRWRVRSGYDHRQGRLPRSSHQSGL